MELPGGCVPRVWVRGCRDLKGQGRILHSRAHDQNWPPNLPFFTTSMLWEAADACQGSTGVTERVVVALGAVGGDFFFVSLKKLSPGTF